ncbi:unnamed protein product [Caenorhabditis nigoni]
MKLLPSTTAILFIWITLQMVRLDDPDDPGKCLRVVNIIRKEVGVEPLKEEDKIEKARLMKKFEPGTKNCPTKDHLENGLDGFTVGRVGGYREEVVVPNGVLTPVIKTFVCIELDCVDHHDITFFFMKNGIDGPPIKNSGTKTFTVTEDMVRKGAPEKASSSGNSIA